MTDTLSPAAAEALASALSTRGPSKGMLKKVAPKYGTPGYFAWQGAMLAVNPYKVSIFSGMLARPHEIALRDEVTAYFDAMPKVERIKYDADRAGLENLGVW